jgi:AcrR family transcriptional regulator
MRRNDSLTVSRQDSRSTKTRIFRAASELFAANGFRGTSVRQIAARARVNEVTIFRLFSSKKALYKSVLESKLQIPLPRWVPTDMPEKDAETFCNLAAELQKTLDPEFIRLLLFTALENPQAVRKSFSPKMDQLNATVGDYIRKRMDCGAMRIGDPQLVAKVLIGLLVYDRIASDFLAEKPLPQEILRTNTASLLEIWLHGVAA